MPDNPKMQYYYRVDVCKADSAFEDDCICWHDEGTGPFPDARHTDQCTKTWRIVADPVLLWRGDGLVDISETGE